MARLTTDIAIIGGGLAGATAAAMLGKAGYKAILVDPHLEQRPEFRCEKLDESQFALLRLAGLADDVLPHTSGDGKVWVVRYGRLVERKRNSTAGILYHDLVNAVRQQIPTSVQHLATKVMAISDSAGGPLVTLASGNEIESRLVILANGLNPGIRETLQIKREVISPCHSISLGFDMQADEGHQFTFPALTVFPEQPGQNMAYLAIFPVRGDMRANLFVYWDKEDARLHKFRHYPNEALLDLIPGLVRFTGPFKINGQVSIRPVDLTRLNSPQRPGIVLVGDAYSTSCPAAGTGVNKVLTDVQRLCSIYVPEWLSNASIDSADVADFYNDPVKVQCEADSLEKALWFRRISTGSSLGLRFWRGARFVAQSMRGHLREFQSMDVEGKKTSDALKGV